MQKQTKAFKIVEWVENEKLDDHIRERESEGFSVRTTCQMNRKTNIVCTKKQW